MKLILSSTERQESVVLVFLLLFLGSNAFFNAFVGFSLPLFLLTVPLSAALAFFFPRVGLVAALLLTIFFERFFTLQSIVIGEAAYKLYPLDCILAAVLLATLLGIGTTRQGPWHWRGADLWLASFFLLVSGIFLFSVFGYTETAGSVAFSTWKNYVFYGVAALAAVRMLRGRRDLMAFGTLLLFGAAVASLFLLIGVLRGGGLWTEYTPLSTAGIRLLAFPHAFYFSLAFLSLLLALPLWWRRVGPRRRRILSMFMVLLVFGVLASLMRHLWLGLAGATLGALLLSPFLFGRSLAMFLGRFVFPLLLLLVGMWYFTALFPGGETATRLSHNLAIIEERIASIGDSYDESFAWRGEVWESAFERFREKPLLGIGFGVSVPVELGGYRQMVEVRNMHNSWLALLIQTGVIGATLFGLFLLSLLFSLWGKAFETSLLRQARFVLTGLLLFQGLVFFSQPYLETNLLGFFFWTTLGVARSLLEFTPDGRVPAST